MKFRDSTITSNPIIGNIYYAEAKDKIEYKDAYRGKILITSTSNYQIHATLIDSYSVWEAGDDNISFGKSIFQFRRVKI